MDDTRPPGLRTERATRARRVAGARKMATDLVTRLWYLPDRNLYDLAAEILAELELRAVLTDRATPTIAEPCDTGPALT